MSKKGLPTGISMRHDSHYVDELSKPNKTIGKIISINLLEPNPEQPRVEIGSLEELSASIKEKGILEPILVKPNKITGNYLIIAGERRWRAANLAGLTEVPCIELDLDEHSIAEIALIENLQRKDLTVWEEADGLAFLKNKFGYKHEEIAKKISKSRSTVTELLSVAGIPEKIRDRCRKLNINSKANLLEVARQFDETEMLNFLDNYSNKTQTINSQNSISKTQKDLPVKNLKTNAPKFLNKELDSKNPTESNIYKYSSEKNNFTLSIDFHDSESFDKKTILQALKESFDSAKQNQ